MAHSLFHASADTAFAAAARWAYDDLDARHLTHRYVLHRRSSQAFAINLFAPLDEAGLVAVWSHLGAPAATVERPVFEWEDETDRLAEESPASRHRTQVDVLLRATQDDRTRMTALIEVKFSEEDFGHCSAFASRKNPSRDVCLTAGAFGGDPDRCFQLQNHGAGRRHYDAMLAGVPLRPPEGLADPGGCVFRTSNSQPMRNIALAHLLLRSRETDKAIYALCAPPGHAMIWRRFREVVDTFPNTADRSLAGLNSSEIARLHPDGGAALTAIYGPGPAGLAATPLTVTQSE